MTESTDPFAHLANETAAGPAETIQALVQAAKRGYFPLRKRCVQLPDDEAVTLADGTATRASVLAEFVGGRQERALEAFLLLHALEPVLEGSPLPLATWARMLSMRAYCTAAGAAAAFATLEHMQLATVAKDGTLPVITPLLEDASGDPWTKPGSIGSDVGKGYFTVPYEYWTSGLAKALRLPGKAMLLIMLAETSKATSFAMAVERAQAWYGISERTAERGYRELSQAGILKVHVQHVADPRHPLGLRQVYHRALESPFSTAARADKQRAAQQAVGAKTTKAANAAQRDHNARARGKRAPK